MSTRKKRIALRRNVILSSLGCSLLIVGVCVAKMITANPLEQEGGAQVAEWNVAVSSNEDSMTLDAGNGSQSYSLVVTNNSEVASTYSIKVSNIPDDVKIGLDISSDADLVTPVDGEIVFTNTGGDLSYIAPDNTRTHSLTLAAEAEADITQSDVDMAIDVIFEQKEPQL